MSIDLFSLFIGLVAGGAVAGIYLELKHLKDEMKSIQADRVKALPHGTLATLEDIHAVINDARFQNADVNEVIKALMLSETKRKYDDLALQRIKELVEDIQEAPRKYKDRPNRKANVV